MAIHGVNAEVVEVAFVKLHANVFATELAPHQSEVILRVCDEKDVRDVFCAREASLQSR
jgi:hypothetical protein